MTSFHHASTWQRRYTDASQPKPVMRRVKETLDISEILREFIKRDHKEKNEREEHKTPMGQKAYFIERSEEI